jgi:hypothetical protein
MRFFDWLRRIFTRRHDHAVTTPDPVTPAQVRPQPTRNGAFGSQQGRTKPRITRWRLTHAGRTITIEASPTRVHYVAQGHAGFTHTQVRRPDGRIRLVAAPNAYTLKRA